MKTLEGGRISIGAMALGLAQGALDVALPYAKERKQFGKRLIDMQPVGFKLSNMAMEIQAARNLVYEAAWRKDHGLPFARNASYAKLFASETAMRAATDAIQILGRHRLHARGAGRAHHARRQALRDRRGHERDPAAGHRPLPGPRRPRSLKIDSRPHSSTFAPAPPQPPAA